MTRKWMALILVLAASSAWAQGELYNAEVTEQTSASDPAKAALKAEDHWLAFRLPVLDGTRSPCCWKGDWNKSGELGCNLKSSYQNFGSRSDSPLSSELIVYSEVRNGEVRSLRLVGEQCPVNGNGAKVTWIGNVDDKAGMDWLEQIAGNKDIGSGDKTALYALALHRNPKAGKRLYSLAMDSRGDLSEEAIFWLGEARGKDGFNWLQQLLAELPNGDRRREINFALAQNDSEEAAELLLKTAQSDSDPEQRGEAMFWLAQAYPEQAEDWLKQLVYVEKDADVLEQAIFAISQLPGDSGSQMLLDLARDNEIDRDARRQALFWLAQSDDDKTIAALTELLTR